MRRTPSRPADVGPAETVTADTTFESTVVEDLPRPAAPEPSPSSEEASAPLGHVGRYSLIKVLGEGGLGTVYEAHDPLLSRTVAVKTLHRGASLSQDSTDRILHEARAAARISHPHIVTVFDAGTSDRGVYIAMELLLGQDLRQALRDGWRPSPTEAASLVRKVADALDFAHSKGVIHCDIKPANIFLVNRKQPKVLDFGIARLSQSEDASADLPITGSPFYLAPEQLRREPLDRRSDVYALGVVLFEMLAGQRPFVGDSMEAITHGVLFAPVPSLRQLNPKVGPQLAALVAKAMARNPDDRPTSAKHLSQLLRRWADSSEAERTKKALSPAMMGMVAGGALAAALGTAWVQHAWLGNTETPHSVASASSALAPLPPSSASMAQSTASSPSVPVAAASEPPPAVTSTDPQPVVSMPAEPGPSIGAPGRDAPNEAVRKVSTSTPSTPRKANEPTAGKSGGNKNVPGVVASGTLHLAISPWGQVEVDGKAVGTSPPLTQLGLPAGTHIVVIRNGDLPAYVTNVLVTEEGHARIQYRFPQ